MNELDSWTRKVKAGKVRMVAVVWLDSAGLSEGGWRARGDTSNYEALHCVSVGFLVKRTGTSVVLSLSITEEQVGNVMAIPRVAIQAMYDLTMKETEPDVEFQPDAHLGNAPGRPARAG